VQWVQQRTTPWIHNLYSLRRTLLLLQLALPTGCFTDIAAIKHGCFWIGAERHRARDNPGRWVVVLKVGADDLIWRLIFFDPCNERSQRIKEIWAGSSAPIQ
jgi:hypothetical protein